MIAHRNPLTAFHAEPVDGTNVPGYGIEDRNSHARFAPGAMTDELLRHISSVTRALRWLNRGFLALTDAHDRHYESRL